jgi:hypothetical protein
MSVVIISDAKSMGRFSVTSCHKATVYVALIGSTDHAALLTMRTMSL